MRVHAEHLTEYSLARLKEVLREATPLAEPVRPRLLRLGRDTEGRVVGIRDTCGIGGEDLVVVNLARDVPLNQTQILVRWNLHRLQP